MEFGAATATLSKKLSNGYGVSGKSAYDGVFATPVQFRAHGFSSRFEDYCEIFGGSEASLGSSIPILEVPELNERKNLDDHRRFKLDYSTVFGGFENLDAAVPYEELFAEPKKKVSSDKEARTLAKGAKQISKEETTHCSTVDPLVSQETSLAGTRKVNMSYHKLSQASENRTNGTTHVAQLHAVPAYTCLIEEVNPPKMNKADQSVPVIHDANLNSGCKERIKESGHCTESVTAPSPDSTNKQSCNSYSKAHNRSHSIHLFFDAPEISNGSSGTKFNEMFPSYTVLADSDDHNGDAVRSMATKCQIPELNASQDANGADSPSYDDMVDSNSEAAASVAALRKAIEEAQERINIAKESMKRKKEGLPDCVKRRFNNDLKAKEKKEAKFTSKTVRVKEINKWQTLGEMDALPQVAAEIGKPVKRTEQVPTDFRAQKIFEASEAVREMQMKSKLPEVEHKVEEVEWKEADHKVTVIEIKQEDSDKEVLHSTDDYQWNDKNTGRNSFEKPEQFAQTTEVIERPQEQETDEGNVSADNEACRCEHLVNENEYKSKEIVDETKLAQQTHNCEAEEQILEVDQYKEDIRNKVGPVLELEDCERKQGDRGPFFNVEDAEKKGEGCSELEECQCDLSAHEEPAVIEQKIAQEQKESEEKVQVSGELEECELSELLEPLDNEKAFNLECTELKSKERKIENLSCVEDQNISNEAGFQDINQEIEHSLGREETDYSFGNMEEIGDDILGEEEIQDRLKNNRESDGNKKPIPAKEIDKEVEGGSNVVEENNLGRHENSEQAELTRVTETAPKYEEEKKEAVKTQELSPMYETDDETENTNKIQEADTCVENDEIQEITSEHDELDNIIKASNASFQHEEIYEEREVVQETNELGEKHTLEASAFTQGSFEPGNISQVPNKSGIVAFDGAVTKTHETVIKVEQDEDQCLKEAKNNGNLTMPIEETTIQSVEDCRDAKEAEVELNEEINEAQCAFADVEKLVDDECNGDTSQLPSMPELKPNTFKDQEIKMNDNNLKENQQPTLTMEEKKADGTYQKVELEKEHTRKIDEAKEREREREKEKLAVERAIREARERAFAEARERAALERAAAEARKKNMSDGRERLGKTAVQATEKAAIEAKLKAERAAVERATAEARARALERALSEKAASVARNKSEKFVSEKSDGTSRDNGTKHNFYSKSFSYGDEFDGVNGDSAQRCKARSERHQRIGERVAKALAEKNMRDRLVQKEQEERNRVAETLDADVKRWSSGKEGNLRALLSTLQYILGPDSGWQPIPLTDIVTATAVKKAYRKATLFVHPDKLQQRGASIQQKYTCEKVFDLLKEAWNKFNMEER